MNQILLMRNGTADFGARMVLRGVSIEMREAELTVIIGPEGSGKSSLLRLIAGIIKLKHGDIFLGEEQISGLNMIQRADKGIRYVSHSTNIISSLTVLKNLEIAVCFMPVEQRNQVIEEMLDLFPLLSENLHRPVKLLQRGIIQALAILTQLIHRPRVLLLDEPLAGLSLQMADAVLDLLTKQREIYKTSMVIVERNMSTVLKTANQAYVLKNGQIFLQSYQPFELVNNRQLGQFFIKDDLMSFAAGA